jgi:hypothetical protein
MAASSKFVRLQKSQRRRPIYFQRPRNNQMAQLKAKRRTVTKPRPKAKYADDFVSVARRLECDEDKERFERKLGKIATAKPQKPK